MGAVRDARSVQPPAWQALVDAARASRSMRLLRQMYSACVLPEAQAGELREWLQKEMSVEDLNANPNKLDAGEALQEMAHALVHDTRSIDQLLARSHDVFRDLAQLLQMATAHLEEDEIAAIEEIKTTLDSDLQTLNEDTRYLLFGGLVSAGKTTLINALLLQLLPDAAAELREDEDGRLNLMPTSFNENTRIVTEVELCPAATEIEVTLLQCNIGLVARAGSPGLAAAASVSIEEDTESAADPTLSDFAPAEGYPITCPGPKAWRKLQKRVRHICETEAPEDAMRRLRIRIPCQAVAQTLSIIDTPGLDSPSVWRQIHTLVHTRAFLFVWVGAMDSATAFGLQGRRMVELYRSTGHPLPPAVVLTKWDRLKALPEFRRQDKLADQAWLRLSQLREGLLPKDRNIHEVKVSRQDDLQELLAALEVSWGDSVTWALRRTVVIGAQSVQRGSVLLTGPRGEEEDTRDNVAEYILAQQLPTTLRFRTDEADSLLLLACCNAAAALSSSPGAEHEAARQDLARLWSSLQPLLGGLSEPLRISRRLQKIVVATQRVINILLKDDDKAMLFERNREDLNAMRERVVQSYSDRVDQYFRGFPKISRRPQYISAGCQPQISLEGYQPPSGLDHGQCAVSLIPKFVQESHEAGMGCNSQFKYVKTVATMTLERWQSKFLENMMMLEQDCVMQMQQQICQLMQINGLINHTDWQASLKGLITSPLEALTLGGLAGGIVGSYGFVLAEVAMGTGAGMIALPIAAIVFAGVAGIMMEDSALARMAGVWNYEEGQERVKQTVLDILNKRDFQAKAKELVVTEFEKRLQLCMGQLADLRDPAASGRAEAQAAVSIQTKVAELQQALGRWFSNFVGEQVGRDPWLFPPPADLRAALLERGGDGSPRSCGPGSRQGSRSPGAGMGSAAAAAASASDSSDSED